MTASSWGHHSAHDSHCQPKADPWGLLPNHSSGPSLPRPTGSTALTLPLASRTSAPRSFVFIEGKGFVVTRPGPGSQCVAGVGQCCVSLGVTWAHATRHSVQGSANARLPWAQPPAHPKPPSLAVPASQLRVLSGLPASTAQAPFELHRDHSVVCPCADRGADVAAFRRGRSPPQLPRTLSILLELLPGLASFSFLFFSLFL